MTALVNGITEFHYGQHTDESVDAITKAAATSIGTAGTAKEVLIKQKASILTQLEDHLH